MEDIWKKLEALSQEKEGESLRLRSGTTEEKIAEAEKTMNLKFPEDFRQYLLTHNGQEDGRKRGSWLLGSLDEIVAQWKDDRELEEEYPEANGEGFMENDTMQNRLKCAQWIPFLGAPYWDQDIAYIDLSPGPKGTAGQVIALVSECDFEVVAPSFDAFLERWLKEGDPI